MRGVPIVLSEHSVDDVWSQYLLHVLSHSDKKCPTTILSIRVKGCEPTISSLRRELDVELAKQNCNPIDVTALTVFPNKLWQTRKNLNVTDFCELCVDKLAPRMKALNKSNQNGIYFERMMSYTGRDGVKVNQLGHVIDRLSGGRRFRPTGLQITCFDPLRDHTRQTRRGFPCLQHVGMTYESDDEIVLTAYYPTHYVFDRAYGNFVGLIQLGEFIAHHSNLKMVRLNCVATSPRLGSVNRSSDSITCLKRTATQHLEQGQARE